MVYPSFVRRSRSGASTSRESISRLARPVAVIIALLSTISACSGDSVLAPSRSTPSAVQPAAGHPSVVVTPNYSAFDTRAEFNADGTIDHLNGFEEFTGELVYIEPSPWTTNGVTYTSALNIILGPGIGFGVASNSISTEFGAQLTGTFDAADAYTLFGADVTLIGSKVPVGLVIFTNLGSYSFANLDIPLATTGRRFFGIGLSNAGEYLTGFRFTANGSASALLLDGVAVGHVALNTNANPEAVVGGPYTGLEGSAVALTMSGTDTDADALTFSWDLGDGTTGSGSVPPTSHVYADNGSYNVMLAVDDGQGGVDTARTTATIANVAPKLAPFSISTTPIPVGSGGVTVPVSANFTDPGTLDTHTASLDCGTGSTTESAAPNGQAVGECTFTTPGFYVVRLTVRDDDGDSDSKVATGQVIVYDPSGDFLTGGGWVMSPIGAYSISTTMTGKLSFNLAARYESGLRTPTGSVDVKLNVGKLDFQSTSLDWMVVANGTARVQGRGTMNGVGDYVFTILASDGSTDAFRIRICNRGTGGVVYDSRPGEPLDATATTALGGGSIQVHH